LDNGLPDRTGRFGMGAFQLLSPVEAFLQNLYRTRHLLLKLLLETLEAAPGQFQTCSGRSGTFWPILV